MTSSSSSPTLRALNVLLLLSTLVVNYLANALPLNGKNTGQLSDQYPNLFTPAGLTFSVWGVIYTGLMGFAIYQALPLFSRRWTTETTPAVAAVGWLFALTSVLNASWIFAWHYEYVTLSVGIMLGLLATLTALNLRLRGQRLAATWRTRWLVEVPFGLYWGWISIATIANVTAWLVDSGWSGLGLSETAWAVLLVAVGAAVTVLVLRRTHRWAYGAVVLWAFLGIVLKRRAEPGDADQPVVIAAGLAMLAVAFALFAEARSARRGTSQHFRIGS